MCGLGKLIDDLNQFCLQHNTKMPQAVTIIVTAEWKKNTEVMNHMFTSGECTEVMCQFEVVQNIFITFSM